MLNKPIIYQSIKTINPSVWEKRLPSLLGMLFLQGLIEMPYSGK